MCQPKCNGGLGVRDIRLVNLSLLAKRRWRLLQNEEGLWKEVLVEKNQQFIQIDSKLNGELIEIN